MTLPTSLGAERRTPEEEGQRLAADMRAQRPADDLNTSGVLKIRSGTGRRQEVPVTMHVFTHQFYWTVVYLTPGNSNVPPEILLVDRRPNQPNQYRSARAEALMGHLPAPEPISGDQTAAPFAGSDFWLSDLGLEFFHWPQQRLIRKEMRKGRSCRVLESLNPNAPPDRYARVLSWIDFETGGLLRAEAYDSKRKLLKEFSVRSFKKVNGLWQLKEIEIRNENTDSRTRLEFDLELPAGQTPRPIEEASPASTGKAPR